MTEENIIQKILSQSQELFNTLRQAKETDLNVYIDWLQGDRYNGQSPEITVSKVAYRQ